MGASELARRGTNRQECALKAEVAPTSVSSVIRIFPLLVFRIPSLDPSSKYEILLCNTTSERRGAYAD